MRLKRNKVFDQNMLDEEKNERRAVEYAKKYKRNYYIIFRNKTKTYDFVTEDMLKIIRSDVSVLDNTDRIINKSKIYENAIEVQKTQEEINR